MEAEIYKQIGQRIKTAREQLGLSQADLSQRLDYNSPATISHFNLAYEKSASKIYFGLHMFFTSLLNIFTQRKAID
ncbi:MAG: helix-turn-helix domain-containing protein [Chloroflexi bacterium]|nr:helix-turn-helix domain-containing protein [Chloroflexota bacterium]